MDEVSVTTPPTPAATRQERELVAGRYRLAAFHRADDYSEVWRALDEATNEVVTLEFLKDSEGGSKERFLAEAKRLASVERPSIMKVSTIHDDATVTFVVFEHLVHVPVPLDWLKREVDAPAPAAVSVPPPAAVEPPAPLVAAPTVIADPPAVIAEPPQLIATGPEITDGSHDHGLAGLLVALRARELALIDTVLVREAAVELSEIVRKQLADLHLETHVARARERFAQLDFSAVGRGLAPLLRRLASARPPDRSARMRVAALESPARNKPARVKTPRVATRPRMLQVRWGRVLFRGLSLAIIAVTLATVPAETLEGAASQAMELGSVAIDSVSRQVSSTDLQGLGNELSKIGAAIGERIGATTAPAAAPPPLAQATFEIPPLSEYSAAFVTQGPYPVSSPNGNVEWVVALRNTGSAGWYRGIDGAQASLALPDGTSAGVQSTSYVGPGQVGWFVTHFRAPAQPGTHQISLLPRIDGRGRLPDLGIYAAVTVSPNP